MNRSFRLLTIRDIELRIHITFPLILVWAAFIFGSQTGAVSGAVFGIIAISLLFVVVALHELGHSFAAQYFGVPVKQIVLTPIGGVAQLQNMPERPIQELIIAIAGPAVNFIIAGAMLLVALPFGSELLGLDLLLNGFGVLSVPAIFTYVFVYNLVLAVFNLIPAFPLDGGRIFRAGLAFFLPYARATNIAALVGRGFAILLGIYALFTFQIFMVVIAVFIFFAGSQEARYVSVRDKLRGYSVQQVFSANAHRLAPSSTLQQAYQMMIYTGQRDFPVTIGETLVGFLSRSMLLDALRTQKSYTWIENIMRRDMPTVAPHEDLHVVRERMMASEQDALPVVESGRFLGIITRRHIEELYRWIQSTPSGVVNTQSA
jgi:Zn-dependent protease